jgi:hypothetical protein
MTLFGIHLVDLLVLAAYFVVILYLGVFLGAKKTKNLGDFFVAGGRWGPLVSFVFVFASAIAGNEAVVVSGQSYSSGLSGVWYWWSFLSATPVYFLFSTYYRRARVYNLAEFLEMRLVKAGIKLPALVDAILTDTTAEEINDAELVSITESDAKQKCFGPRSTLEFRREANANWYSRGFALVTASCVGLVVGTWFVTRLLFVWQA